MALRRFRYRGKYISKSDRTAIHSRKPKPHFLIFQIFAKNTTVEVTKEDTYEVSMPSEKNRSMLNRVQTDRH